MHKPLITLTTDFGYADPFVGVMKGVIYGINPQANIVDLTHSITPQNIEQAAFIIGMHYNYFPKNSIHLVVVDPGVGSARRPVLAVADGHYFIGPDNGVFSYVYKQVPEDLQVIRITSEHLFLMKDSPTFQGRDVFAPSAAWLSTGKDIGYFGEIITDYHVIDLPAPVRQTDQLLQGEIILIDRFGNAITNIRKSELDELSSIQPGAALKILLAGKEIQFKGYYSQAPDKSISVLINSSGLLEFFVYRGNAALQHNILPGDVVKVVFSSE